MVDYAKPFVMVIKGVTSVSAVGLRVFCLFLSLVILSGCSAKQPLHLFSDDEKLITKINLSVDTIYPGHFKIIHHVVLDLAKKNYVLNGYIRVDRKKDQFSINAQNDLGGSIFEIDSTRHKTPEITMPFKAFKEAWLKNSVIRDLNELYLSRPFPSPVLAVENDTWRLIQKNDSGVDEERVFGKLSGEEKYQLKSYSKLKSGKTIYRIDYKYKNTANGYYPDLISITDKKMHYSLKINALYFINNK